MVRRFRILLASMGLFLLTLTGCEGLRHATRTSGSASSAHQKAANEALGVDSDASKIQAVDADPKNPKSFFSNNRRSGTWSSEAREIESHLGVGP